MISQELAQTEVPMETTAIHVPLMNRPTEVSGTDPSSDEPFLQPMKYPLGILVKIMQNQ